MFENRRWLVIPTSLTGSINFDEVQESSVDSLRFSVDGSKTFVKYDISEITASYSGSYINAETGETGSYVVEAGIYGRPSVYSNEYIEYTHSEILDLLSTPEWTSPLSGSRV